MELDPRLGLYALFAFLIVVITIGLAFGIETKVEPEYMSGVLTASAILLGFWAILIQRKPKKDIEIWRFKHLIGEPFLISFITLVVSVVPIKASAIL